MEFAKRKSSRGSQRARFTAAAKHCKGKPNFRTCMSARLRRG